MQKWLKRLPNLQWHDIKINVIRSTIYVESSMNISQAVHFCAIQIVLEYQIILF